MRLVRNREMSIRKAAERFKIDKSVLSRRLSGKTFHVHNNCVFISVFLNFKVINKLVGFLRANFLMCFAFFKFNKRLNLDSSSKTYHFRI